VSTEIEKLERRWQDNPRGLTFAPLAEAYRKNGSLARALELLDTGLAQHPRYVPAHIVRGRCHLDSGERALAELDFLCVAEIDPENVIALKALADLAEEEGRTSDAIRRLESLLEIDRNNDEAEAQLDRLRAEQTPAPPSAPVGDFRPRNDSAALTPSPVRLEGIEISEIELDIPSTPAEAGVPGIVLEAAEAENQAAALEPVIHPEPVDTSLRIEPVRVEDPGQELLGEAVARGELSDLPEELTAWLEDPMNLEAVAEPGPVGDPAPASESNQMLGIDPDRVETVQHPDEDEPAAIGTDSPAEPEEPVLAESEPEPELMVTETMAEIFLRQGHQELALAVYTQLLQREPDNPRISAAAAQLADILAPPPPPAPEPPPPEPVRHFDAESTGGTPVSEFLTTLLTAGRPRPATSVHPPAFDREEENKPPSFDEFFATDAPPAPAGAAQPSVPSASRPEVGPRTGEAEELEQFHAWLRGLKS